ncbi:hypothetical protein HanXRQr2_Chr11g0477471 [Helianthus annuus]|uniref:Uncharacterized protein n=1 Tax=Helianthus annuus TaxID=4232 RepID=A0A251T9I2_HELAN|nr:hypothetical protein HanXRQr2_Chr11g0477471 [Helianthus annuus]KAJ0874110.1 hypothetical protein HanPSC8_Chr11g0460241 [Helianthus annuus]
MMHGGFELESRRSRMNKYPQARCGKAWKTTWQTSGNGEDFPTSEGMLRMNAWELNITIWRSDSRF